MASEKTVYLVGSASGMAAADSGCGNGPIVLQQSPYLTALSAYGLDLYWKAMLTPPKTDSVLSAVTKHNENLAATISASVRDKQFFLVIGGDHSCAIGTWSGAVSQCSQQGPLGLIWIDAHLDSHTPMTSETGNIHGMPLACLLGRGDSALISILGKAPKFRPEHVCVIGARSYESGEAALMKNLNVRVFYMDEVLERGLDVVFDEALSIVKNGTAAYGVTVDIDSIDPNEAPGTGVAEEGGLSVQSLCQALCKVAHDKHLVGAEIVEFDPHLDKNHMTEKIIPRLIAAMTLGKVI